MAGQLERLTDFVLLYKFRYEVMQKTVSKLLGSVFCEHVTLQWLRAEHKYLSPLLVERLELSKRFNNQPRHH